MPDYIVVSDRILTGTISDLPATARLAWLAILFKADKLRGRVKLPVRDLAKMASISTPEAAEALQLFLSPDPYSSSKELDGRRLLPVDGENDWYDLVTWEAHAKERKAFFNRLRQQKARNKKEAEKERNAEQLDSEQLALREGSVSRIVTNEPEPESEPEVGSKKEREIPTARTKKGSKKTAEADSGLPSLRAYATQGFLIATWAKKQPSQGGVAFEAAFEAAFEMTWAVWCEIKRRMELSIPKSCRDDNHTFEGSYCIYCPFISAGEPA